jgi:hypothetical protein
VRSPTTNSSISLPTSAGVQDRWLHRRMGRSKMAHYACVSFTICWVSARLHLGCSGRPPGGAEASCIRFQLASFGQSKGPGTASIACPPYILQE